MVFEFYDTIDSTNTEASRQLDELSSVHGGFIGLHKKVIWSRSQTAGRGRLGRAFFSPESGLYMSLIYCPCGDSFDPAIYTAAAAVAVGRAVRKLYKKECSIKWVNDVYVSDKKVCGILTEGKIDLETKKVGAIIVGIGINVFTPEESFPPEIRQRAGSVLCDRNEAPDVSTKTLMEEVALECCRIYDSLGHEESNILLDAMKEYRKCSNLMGKKVTVTPVIEQKEGMYEALVTDISEDARLVVRLENGEIRHLSSGEVTLHL